MTIGELAAFLATLPQDMEVVETRYSDVGPMELASWQLILIRPGRWGDWAEVIRHPKDPDHETGRQVLHYAGN